MKNYCTSISGRWEEDHRSWNKGIQPVRRCKHRGRVGKRVGSMAFSSAEGNCSAKKVSSRMCWRVDQPWGLLYLPICTSPSVQIRWSNSAKSQDDLTGWEGAWKRTSEGWWYQWVSGRNYKFQLQDEKKTGQFWSRTLNSDENGGGRMMQCSPPAQWQNTWWGAWRNLCPHEHELLALSLCTPSIPSPPLLT